MKTSEKRETVKDIVILILVVLAVLWGPELRTLKEQRHLYDVVDTKVWQGTVIEYWYTGYNGESGAFYVQNVNGEIKMIRFSPDTRFDTPKDAENEIRNGQYSGPLFIYCEIRNIDQPGFNSYRYPATVISLEPFPL